MFQLSSCAVACLASAAPPETPALEPGSAQTVGEIVVLGRRRAPRDQTLGVGAAAEKMSPASRAIEDDLIRTVGATRLAGALELVSSVSQQNNRGGVMDNFAIRGFLDPTISPRSDNSRHADWKSTPH